MESWLLSVEKTSDLMRLPNTMMPLHASITSGTRSANWRSVPSIGAAVVPGGGSLPVAGRITSPFGMRVHPVTGVYKLHDGADIAAACGTAIALPVAGTVSGTSWSSAYGWRVFVEHAGGQAADADLGGHEVGAVEGADVAEA